MTAASERLSWKARTFVGLLLAAMAASFVALYVTTDRGLASTGNGLSGPASSEAEPPSTDASGRPVTTTAGQVSNIGLVGDSLTEGIQAALPALAEAKGWKLQIDAKRGREADGSAPLVQQVASGKDLMIVALGTNDSRKGLGVDDATKLIDEIMLQVGAEQRVLWVNVVRQDSKATTAAANNFDTALTKAAERLENLTVLDWAAYVKAHPNVMSGDRIHLTDKGYEERAQWLIDQITAATSGQPSGG